LTPAFLGKRQRQLETLPFDLEIIKVDRGIAIACQEEMLAILNALAKLEMPLHQLVIDAQPLAGAGKPLD
jgi:hypothetical protein